MPRPGFILDVETSTPPILFCHGNQLTTEKLPSGSKVIYGPEPTPGILDVASTIRRSLEHPLDSDPLASLLTPETKLTIAIDPTTPALFQPRDTDFRQIALEAILDIAATARVEDVELIVARGLDRRLTNSELRAVVGDRILDSFSPKSWLTQHDAENQDELIQLTDGLHINKRSAESDLLVYVGLVGISEVHNLETISRNLGAARNSEWKPEYGETLAKNINIFCVSATLSNDAFPSQLSFMQKREQEWGLKNQALYLASKTAAELVPNGYSDKLAQKIRSNNTVTGIWAGAPEAVGLLAKDAIRAQHMTAIEGQADVLTLGIPWTGPFSANSTMNPVLVAATALVHYLGSNTGQALVRDGGALIIHHPFVSKFNPVNHPSFIDFFKEVLTQTTDAALINDKFSDKFANDPWYRHLYQNSHAVHGTQPIRLWNKCMQAADKLGGVIVVGGETNSVHRLGFKAASTLQDAFEMSRDITKKSEPSIVHAHMPPAFLVDVK